MPTSPYYVRKVPHVAGHAKYASRRRFLPALGPLPEHQSLYRFNIFARNQNSRGVGADSFSLARLSWCPSP